MNFIEAIILGLVQGLTEFLAISSSAHLRILGEFLPSATDPGATFTAITQIGTEATSPASSGAGFALLVAAFRGKTQMYGWAG